MTTNPSPSLNIHTHPHTSTHSYVTFKEIVRLSAIAAGKPEAKDKVVIYDPAKKKVGARECVCERERGREKETQWGRSGD